MRIRVISVGKTNIDFVKQALELYCTRIRRYISLSWEELPDVKNSQKLNPNQLKKAEGKQFLAKLTATDHVILLDESGKSPGSVEFAKIIEHHMNYNSADLCFVIGGAYGFSEKLYDRSQQTLSLSKMTFSHQIIRAIFAEQLYRSFTIIRGEPYHHA